MPVESAAISASEQRSVGGFPDGAIDRASGPRREWDQGGQVPFADDPQGAVAVRVGEVGDVRAACFGNAQGIEGEQAGQDVVLPQARPAWTRNAPGSLRSRPSRVDSWAILGRRTCTAGECSSSCSSTQ